MSVELDIPQENTDTRLEDLAGTEPDTFPQPPIHGCGVQFVEEAIDDNGNAILYNHLLEFWREHVGDRSNQPIVVGEGYSPFWLDTDTEYCFAFKSSKWKAGKGDGTDYRPYYKYHLNLRRKVERGGTVKLVEPEGFSLSLRVIPQYHNLVYKDGNEFSIPYGAGTKVKVQSTWAESPQQMEKRAYDALAHVFGKDVLNRHKINPRSQRIWKLEAHIRFHIQKKTAAIDVLDQSKQLVDYGGGADMNERGNRIREGWVEKRCVSDRWEILGFEAQTFRTSIKCYQTKDFHERPESDPAHHPKLESAFAGSGHDSNLPTYEEWDSVVTHLRKHVATHARWADINPGDLVADDFQNGAAEPDYTYEKPTGRRDQLRLRYQNRETYIWKEAQKANTESVYDILDVVREENGATYDMLEEKTGLARSTIRYHCKRLEEQGILRRLGNPVLVVYEARVLLKRAQVILSQIKPDDMKEDRKERAEQRRTEREAQEDSDDQEESCADQDDQGPDRERNWRYFEHLDIAPNDLAQMLECDELGGKDVRVDTAGTRIR